MTTSPVKVGSILLVLQKIVRHLDTSKLIELRLVNKIWKKVSTDQLLKRDAVQMKITTASLKNALKILDWTYLPTTHFNFSAPSMDLDLIEEFILYISPCCQTLTINFNPLILGLVNFENYVVLIRGVSDSVEKLFLHPVFKWYELKKDKKNNQKKDTNNNNNSIKLPKLKELNFLVDPDCEEDLALTRGSIGYKILMDNLDTLETVHGFWLRGVSRLENFWTTDISNGKNILSIIKSFYYNRNLMEFDDLQNFANAGPQLIKMSLFDFKPTLNNDHFKDELYKILQSSNNTLDTLYSSPFLHFSDGNLPILNSLTTLILKIDEHQNLEHYFDVNDTQLSSVQRKCPQLKTVKLTMDWTWRGSGWRNVYSSWSDRRGKRGFLSVENLELCGEYVPERNETICPAWWRRLKTLFPDVKRLKLKGMTDICVVLQEVYLLWPQLRVLELDIPHDMAKTRGNALDSCFTGISRKMIYELKQNYYKNNFVLDFNEIGKLQTSSSLCNLKDLRRLDCILVGNYHSIGPSWISPFSIISCLYAFSLIPNLEVNFCFLQNHVKSPVIREKLGEVKEFVTFKSIPPMSLY